MENILIKKKMLKPDNRIEKISVQLLFEKYCKKNCTFLKVVLMIKYNAITSNNQIWTCSINVFSYFSIFAIQL